MTTETKQFYMRLHQLSCEKLDVSYSDASAWVKQEAGLSLHRISIICIIASRSEMYIFPAEEKMRINVSNRVVDISQKLS